MPVVPISTDLTFVPIPKQIAAAIRSGSAVVEGFKLLNGTLVESALAASRRGRAS